MNTFFPGRQTTMEVQVLSTGLLGEHGIRTREDITGVFQQPGDLNNGFSNFMSEPVTVVKAFRESHPDII